MTKSLLFLSVLLFLLIGCNEKTEKKVGPRTPEFDGNIPSFFFMTNKEEVQDAVVGYFKENDFLEYIKEIEDL